jgi:hypothetical protein
MLHGLNLGASLDKRRGSLDSLHMIGERINDGFVRKVGTAEFVAVTSRSGMEGEGDFPSGVQSAAAQAGAFCKSTLMFHENVLSFP